MADNLAAVVAGRGLLGFFGFASFFIFSTFLFGPVRSVLNRVLQVKQERTFIKGMGVDLLMIGLTALFLLIGIIATWSLTAAGALIERNTSWGDLLNPGMVVLGKAIGVTVMLLLFYLLYRFPPAATMSNRALLIASVTGTVLFQFTRLWFAWYVAVAQANLEYYGTVGGLLFLFVWLYYVSLVFIVGAEFGRAYDQQRLVGNS